MPLVDAIFPDPRLRQVHHVAVSSEPEVAWDALERMDFRTAGLRPLGDDAGRELVVGGIARSRFWNADVHWAHPADGFAGFTEPGWGKLAWSLRIDPRIHGGSWLTFDLRAGATDDEAWRRFHRAWRVPGRFALPIRRAVLDRLARELGAPAPRALPGDELLCTSCSERTRRRFVEVPASRLWPWIVDGTAEIGAEVDAPTYGAGEFAVLRVDEGRSLVIGTPTLLADAPPDPTTPLRSTWAFVIEPIGDEASLLEVRVRTEYRPTFRAALEGVARGAIDEVVERRALRSLCERAEHAALH
jgi:hypothetical protein